MNYAAKNTNTRTHGLACLTEHGADGALTLPHRLRRFAVESAAFGP